MSKTSDMIFNTKIYYIFYINKIIKNIIIKKIKHAKMIIWALLIILKLDY